MRAGSLAPTCERAREILDTLRELLPGQWGVLPVPIPPIPEMRQADEMGTGTCNR